MKRSASHLLVALGVGLGATGPLAAQPTRADAPRPQTVPAARGAAPTVAEARAFLDSAERELQTLGVKSARASWVAATYITDDTEALSADAQERFNVAVQQWAMRTRRYEKLELPPTCAAR